MNNNVLWMLQSMTVDQLKKEIDNNSFVDKKLKDYDNGRKAIDGFKDIQNMDQDVQYALLMYAIYKIKGGK
ncbi:MAG: hypothetical protein PUB90_01115 [bacterium]|nr:hypothetical protein [bacterium]